MFQHSFNNIPFGFILIMTLGISLLLREIEPEDYYIIMRVNCSKLRWHPHAFPSVILTIVTNFTLFSLCFSGNRASVMWWGQNPQAIKTFPVVSLNKERKGCGARIHIQNLFCLDWWSVIICVYVTGSKGENITEKCIIRTNIQYLIINDNNNK